MCWGQHSAAYLIRRVKTTFTKKCIWKYLALEKKYHFKLKRYIHFVRAEGFFSFCILILEVGWLLVPLCQGLLIFKRSTGTANSTFYK